MSQLKGEINMSKGKNKNNKLDEELLEIVKKKKENRKEIKKFIIGYAIMLGIVGSIGLVLASVFMLISFFANTYVIVLFIMLAIASFLGSTLIKESINNKKREKIEIEELVDFKVKEIEKELTKSNKCNANEIKKYVENNIKNERDMQIYELREYRNAIKELIKKYDDSKEETKVKVLKKDNKNT